MGNKIYGDLIADMILFPFTRSSFTTEKDPLCDYAKAYKSLISTDCRPEDQTRKNLKDTYKKSAKELIRYFSSDFRWHHIDDVQMLLNMFYPGLKLSSFLSDDKTLWNFYVRHIFDLAKVFITFRDGTVALKNWVKESDPLLSHFSEYDKIELWSHISRRAIVDLLIAACYVNFGVDDIACLYNAPDLIYLADMPLKLVLQRGVAETHMHANAGISYQIQWQSQMSFEYKSDKIPTGLLFCSFFRFCSARYFEQNEYNGSFLDFLCSNQDDREKLSYFFELLKEKDEEYVEKTGMKGYGDKIWKQYHSLKEKYKYKDKDKTGDFLLDTVYLNYRYMSVSSEIIWYYQLLSHIKKNYDPLLCEYFFAYVRLKNEFFANKIQKTAIGGLDYFQERYNNATELKPDELRLWYYYIFREQCRTGNLEIIELKINPKVKSGSHTKRNLIDLMKMETLHQIKDIVGGYKKYIESRMETANDNIRFPQLGLIYHFIKNNDSDNFNGLNCCFQYHLEMHNCFDYNSIREKDMLFIDALYELMSEVPLLTDYVVGIDAASIENDAEPWVFAPVFKYARTSENTVPFSSEKRSMIQNIGFTYHVGEDFRHIVSGLRHIDEVLTHFEYRSGDRLGHAIALGVDVDKWISENRIVAIPIGEYLDNLLWMWQYAKSSDLKISSDNLELRIMQTAEQIYGGNAYDISVFTLWKVYQEKFKMYNTDYVDVIAEKGICSLNPGVKGDGKYEFKWLVSTHYCPCYYEIYSRTVFVTSSGEEAEFIKRLQREIIKKAEGMGVYVETNPSSNSIIGDIPSIFDHPIIRLNNEGLGTGEQNCNCVLSSINSDDPIVFSTFVENEFAYIYYSLLNEGCKRERVLDWIDKIRKHGLDSTFIKHKKTTEEMLDDFNKILKHNIVLKDMHKLLSF